jgi:hypothetical protein
MISTYAVAVRQAAFCAKGDHSVSLRRPAVALTLPLVGLQASSPGEIVVCVIEPNSDVGRVDNVAAVIGVTAVDPRSVQQGLTKVPFAEQDLDFTPALVAQLGRPALSRLDVLPPLTPPRLLQPLQVRHSPSRPNRAPLLALVATSLRPLTA